MQIFIYILSGIIAVFFLFQMIMFAKMKLKKGKLVPEIGGAVGEILKAGGKSIFYFYSPNCRACTSMTPIVDRLSVENKNLYKINILKDINSAQKFGVMGTPSLVVVEEGVIKEFLVGHQPEEKIYGLL
jgi:thioredoxin 1